jgi:hypothetical protein
VGAHLEIDRWPPSPLPLVLQSSRRHHPHLTLVADPTCCYYHSLNVSYAFRPAVSRFSPSAFSSHVVVAASYLPFTLPVCHTRHALSSHISPSSTVSGQVLTSHALPHFSPALLFHACQPLSPPLLKPRRPRALYRAARFEYHTTVNAAAHRISQYGHDILKSGLVLLSPLNVLQLTAC